MNNTEENRCTVVNELSAAQRLSQVVVILDATIILAVGCKLDRFDDAV